MRAASERLVDLESFVAWKQVGLHVVEQGPANPPLTHTVYYFDQAQSRPLETVVFDSQDTGHAGHIIKTLSELGYTTEAVDLYNACQDALEDGWSVSDIQALALDYFYGIDPGAYDQYTDHVSEPRPITQQIELPSGWLKKIA